MDSRLFTIALVVFAIGAAPSTDATSPATNETSSTTPSPTAATVESTTEPSTASADAASPKACLKAYNLAMRNGDAPTMISLQHAVTDDQRYVARCSSQADLRIATLERAARDRFGDDGAQQMAFALDDLNDAAVDASHETINGDHASVTFADNGAPIPMIYAGARWLIDVGAILTAYKGAPGDYCDGLIRRGSVAKVTAQEIDAGQFVNISAAVEALKSRLKES